MSLTDHFYHSTLRKYIIGFGTIFNGFTVQRGTDPDITTINVPIAYGSKQKWLARLQQNPDLKKPHAVNLPRMSFIITNLMYDTERKTSSIAKMTRVNYTDNTTALRTFHPVPYNIDIALTIYAKNMDDYLQIFEQIIPFFKPEFSISIRDIDNINVLKDIPIILNDINFIHDSEGSVDEYRVINGDLNFTIKGNFYGPIKDLPIIREVVINTRVGLNKYDKGNSQPDTRMTVTPDPDTVFADEDYGFTTELEERPDGEWDDEITWPPTQEDD